MSTATVAKNGRVAVDRATGEAIAAAAVALVRTRVRFHDQARGPDAVDCIGLATCAARAAGLSPHDWTTYDAENPDQDLFLEHMRRACVRVVGGLASARPGDGIVHWIGKPWRMKHVSLYVGRWADGERGIAHAHMGARHALIMDLDAPDGIRWRERVHSVWRLRVRPIGEVT